MKLYLVINERTGRAYVGITKRSLKRRWQGHVQDSRKGSKRALCCAIRKYGEDAFSINQVDAADDWESLCEKETELIESLKTVGLRPYNMTRGGDGVAGLPKELVLRMTEAKRGRKHTPEAIEKIRATSTGRRKSAETKAKLSLAHSGKKLSAEHRQKLSEAKMGKKRGPHSAEHSARISEALKKSWAAKKASK